MTPGQVKQVQATFARLEEESDAAATLFYDRLFEIVPEARPLFQDDMAEQRRKLMSMLGMVVIGLDRLDAILPAVTALAVRHVGYGVRPEHYRTVGDALLWTLKEKLGPAWTREVAAAWDAAYEAISDHMTVAAYGREGRAAVP